MVIRLIMSSSVVVEDFSFIKLDPITYLQYILALWMLITSTSAPVSSSESQVS
jgi:hypothetical protein